MFPLQTSWHKGKRIKLTKFLHHLLITMTIKLKQSLTLLFQKSQMIKASSYLSKKTLIKHRQASLLSLKLFQKQQLSKHLNQINPKFISKPHSNLQTPLIPSSNTKNISWLPFRFSSLSASKTPNKIPLVNSISSKLKQYLKFKSKPKLNSNLNSINKTP